MPSFLPPLLTGLLVAISTTAQAEPRLSVRQEGNIIIVKGALEPDVGPADAWSVLTDYGRFSEFVPGIRLNRVISEDGSRKLVEQQGELMAGTLKVPYFGTMQIDEIPSRGLRILFLNGLFKDVQGTWQLSDSKPVKLGYEMRMDLVKSPYPPAMAQAIAQQQVKTWVAVFATEMERRKNRKKP